MTQNSQQSILSPRRVSVVVPSYNHEKFLPLALESVVGQTYKDYEILLIDDASSDRSVDRIREFIDHHPEIPCRFSCHEHNQGGVITLNDLVQQARGEYIALINSDDLWQPDKLEQQVAYLDAHPEVGAVFTQARIIDDDGQVVSNTVDFPHDIFMQKNRSRGKWLRRLFYELNCLCHPSILIRKAVYDQVGLYDARFRQLPDMQMWVRVLKYTAIHMIEKPLVSLRFHTTNTSQVNSQTTTRNLNEIIFIMQSFFDGMSDDVLVDGFSEFFKNKNASQPGELACEKAFLYFTPDSLLKSLYNHIGLQQLYRLLAQPDTRQVLREQYDFGYEDFFRMGGTQFFDEYLILSRHTATGPAAAAADAPAAPPADPLPTSWRYVLALNKHFLSHHLIKYPLIHKPLSWGWRLVKRVVK